jgi:hypothetical protein
VHKTVQKSVIFGVRPENAHQHSTLIGKNMRDKQFIISTSIILDIHDLLNICPHFLYFWGLNRLSPYSEVAVDSTHHEVFHLRFAFRNGRRSFGSRKRCDLNYRRGLVLSLWKDSKKKINHPKHAQRTAGNIPLSSESMSEVPSEFPTSQPFHSSSESSSFWSPRSFVIGLCPARFRFLEEASTLKDSANCCPWAFKICSRSAALVIDLWKRYPHMT